MSDRLKELREKRGKIVTDMRALTDAASTEKRDLSDDELGKHGEMFDECERVGKQIEAEERSLHASKLIAEREADKGKKEDRTEPKDEAELRSIAFRSWLKTGSLGAEGADEFRAFQAANPTEGGYLVTPEQFVNNLIKALDDAVFIRDLATTYQVPDATSLGAPSLDTDAEDSDWTEELGTGQEEDSIRFGKRVLQPHPMAKRVKISNKLIRQVPNAESLITGRLVYKMGITQEKGFMTGDGQKKPLGVFVASSQGISTGRDISTGNSTTAISFDGLIEAKYALKAPYWAKANWIFHRDAVKQITKLKDGDGQYLWQPSVRDGEPDRILALPFRVSEYCPNTFTTGLYVGILGDFSHYWIADALNMQMQRLTELYAETNQIGFIGRLESDGMPVLEEAFARVKLA